MGDTLIAKNDGSCQLHSKALEDNTPIPRILQSEDTRSSDFDTPETLSKNKEEDSPEVLNSEDPSMDSEGST